MSRSRSMRPRELVPRGQSGNRNPYGELANMQQRMMRGFGGFGDDFFGGLMRFDQDPFESMFKFSDLHQKLHSKNMDGGFVCQTFVSSSKKGPDGKMITEHYYDNNMGQHRNGQTISEKQQAYKNSSGINRLAEERMLNDQGRKIVKEKRGNAVEVTNHYFNIDEEHAQDFDSRWEQADRDTKFREQYRKYIGNGSDKFGRSNMLDINRPMDYERPAVREQPRAIQQAVRPDSRHAAETRSQASFQTRGSHLSTKASTGSRRN